MLADERLTGMSTTHLEQLAARLAPAQAARTQQDGHFPIQATTRYRSASEPLSVAPASRVTLVG